jgi:hypothetical protein
MDPNLVLWIGQVLPAIALLGFGFAHSIDVELTDDPTLVVETGESTRRRARRTSARRCPSSFR